MHYKYSLSIDIKYTQKLFNNSLLNIYLFYSSPVIRNIYSLSLFLFPLSFYVIYLACISSPSLYILLNNCAVFYLHVYLSIFPISFCHFLSQPLSSVCVSLSLHVHIPIYTHTHVLTIIIITMISISVFKVLQCNFNNFTWITMSKIIPVSS